MTLDVEIEKIKKIIQLTQGSGESGDVCSSNRGSLHNLHSVFNFYRLLCSVYIEVNLVAIKIKQVYFRHSTNYNYFLS